MTTQTQFSGFLGLLACLGLTGCLVNPFDPVMFYNFLPNGRTKPVRASEIFASADGKEMAWAIVWRNRAKIKKLAASPALVNLRGPHEITPLWLAVELRDRESVRLLLEAGADPSIQMDDVYPVLISALTQEEYHGEDGIFDLLMDYGADPNIEYRTSGTATPAIFYADYSKKKIKRLMDAGADINATDDRGSTPVTLKAHSHRVSRVLFYLELGADWRKPAFGGRDLLGCMDRQIFYGASDRQRLEPIYQWLRDHGQIDARNQPLPAQATPEKGTSAP